MPEHRQQRALRMGVIGTANIAIRRIMPVLAAHDHVDLVAVASRDKARAERVGAAFGCAGMGDYAALVERDDLDAVYIPLPPGMHHEWALRALRSGKHVLVEKPMSDTYEKTLELMSTASELGLVLAENFMFLHHSQHAAVRAMLDESVGELRHFSGSFAVPPLAPDSFRYQPALGGGALLDVGVYPLRAAQLYLTGELDVLGACLRVDETTGADVAGSVLLSDDRGVTAQLDFGFEHSYRSTYALWGNRGRVSVRRAFTPPEQLKPVVRIEQQDVVTERSLPEDNQVYNAMNAFVRAALTGGGPLADMSAIRRQAFLVDRVRRAARLIGDPKSPPHDALAMDMGLS
ncbi:MULTISPECIES: Gfo/Idh/MocA family protein [Streptomyces]|nr:MULTISPECIES: Gfo/Idh/MocA family oxidoreductase [Streptomyces]UUA06992.1 Gfo/Idh/MocA family oxidoreductase [Streptomyces koelreuteriae]UUA14621.1 Gfo/Idh/MocA family oxidoreductase [Streptomyces sp. CRCS-T-1]